MIQELRIGNLVYDDRNCETVIFSLDTEINHDDLWQKYTGVPLNEDWLLMFGFEEQTPKYFVLDLGDFSMRYYYNFSGSTWKFELEDKLLNIEFVHQFQNLFFTLTNKELILK